MSGIPKCMSQSELERIFSPFGRIITSRILCDNLSGKCALVLSLSLFLLSFITFSLCLFFIIFSHFPLTLSSFFHNLTFYVQNFIN